MTIAFIKKRINEQKLYIWDIANSSLPAHRKREIITSAKGQQAYFENLLTNHESKS